ncbi:MAG: hypothetical protein AXW14_08535 [Alteromonas sp. Nap_26]|nr:MAG: hypothetical protein AXW14_08535 [Alteromonas sp. Nap_26]
MAKLGNRNSLRTNPSIANNMRSRGQQRSDGFANLEVHLPNGTVIPMSRVGISLNRTDDPSTQMQALHNYMLENPEESTGLVVKIKSIHVQEKLDDGALDIGAMLQKEQAPELDETTSKLKSLMQQTN